jgi:predicted PurR-regulated permease PerM
MMKRSPLWRELRDDCGLIVLPAFLVATEMKPHGWTLLIFLMSAAAFIVYRTLPWRHNRWKRSHDEEAETFRTWIVRSHAVLIFILLLAPTAAIIVQLIKEELPNVANETFIAQGAQMRAQSQASVNPPLEPKSSYIGVIDAAGKSHINLNPSTLVISSFLEKSTNLAQTLPAAMLLFFFVFAVALLFGEHIGGRTYGLEGQ